MVPDDGNVAENSFNNAVETSSVVASPVADDFTSWKMTLKPSKFTEVSYIEYMIPLLQEETIVISMEGIEIC